MKIRWDREDILEELLEEFREEVILRGGSERDLEEELENTLTLWGDWSEYGRCGKFRAMGKWYHLIYDEDEAIHIAKQVARETIEDIMKRDPDALPYKWYDKYVDIDEEAIDEIASEFEKELMKEYGVVIVSYDYPDRPGDVEYEEVGDVEKVDYWMDEFYSGIYDEPISTLALTCGYDLKEILKEPYIKIRWDDMVTDWVKERGWSKVLGVTTGYYETKNGLIYFPVERRGG
jgi:hypothetical protein